MDFKVGKATLDVRPLAHFDDAGALLLETGGPALERWNVWSTWSCERGAYVGGAPAPLKLRDILRFPLRLQDRFRLSGRMGGTDPFLDVLLGVPGILLHRLARLVRLIGDTPDMKHLNTFLKVFTVPFPDATFAPLKRKYTFRVEYQVRYAPFLLRPVGLSSDETAVLYLVRGIAFRAVVLDICEGPASQIGRTYKTGAAEIERKTDSYRKLVEEADALRKAQADAAKKKAGGTSDDGTRYDPPPKPDGGKIKYEEGDLHSGGFDPEALKAEIAHPLEEGSDYFASETEWKAAFEESDRLRRFGLWPDDEI